MAANMWENSLKNVKSDNNKILYETLLDFFTAKRYLFVVCFGGGAYQHCSHEGLLYSYPE
jgi:hypothetical protein